MTPSEIIAADAQQHGIEPARVLSYVSSVLEGKKGTIVTAGNSVLLIVNIGNNNAELHLYTVDSPADLMRIVPMFIDSIRQTPIKAVYGKADNDGIIKLLTRLGVQVQQSNRPEYNWMAPV